MTTTPPTPDLTPPAIDATQPPIPEPYKSQGYVYRDIPGKLSPEMWDKLLAIFGEGNYVLLASSESKDPANPWKRGQFFLSPQALENLKAHTATKN